MEREVRAKKLLDKFTNVKEVQKLLDFLDCFGFLAADLNFPTLRENRQINSLLEQYENIMADVGEVQMKIDDFEMLKRLGCGGFGEVQLVKHKASQKKFAIKCLSKHHIIERSEYASSLWLECDIMRLNNPLFIQLHATFQDTNYLYMVMDYMAGGDLSSRISVDGMSEECVQFYAAELVLALDSLHAEGYIHRDIKPQNLMLDCNGHIKLTDFGLAAKLNSNGLVYKGFAGTLGYAAPEVITADEHCGAYGPECDWWSFGVVIYEMLTGLNPFHNEDNNVVFNNTLNYRNLAIPIPGVVMSQEAISILRALLTHRERRIGSKEIKSHGFFQNKPWTFETITETKPPLNLTEDRDTKKESVQMPLNDKHFKGNQLLFVGYSAPLEKEFQTVNGTLTENQPNPELSDSRTIRNSPDTQIESVAEQSQVKQEPRHENPTQHGGVKR